MTIGDELGLARLSKVGGIVAVNELGRVRRDCVICELACVRLINFIHGYVSSEQNFVVRLALVLFENEEYKKEVGL